MTISRGSLRALALFALFAGLTAFAQNSVPLAVEGKAAAVVVVPDGADGRSPEWRAAALLTTHLALMSGARLEVKRERDLGTVRLIGGRLVLATPVPAQGLPGEALLGTEGVPGETAGAARQTPSFLLVGAGNLTKMLGAEAEGVGVGGIRLKTFPNAVVLLGGPTSTPGEPGDDAEGVRYAAIELLERLGCGYLWPGPTGKVVPKRATVSVEPLDVRYTPSIRCRHIRVSGWSDRSDTGLKHLGVTQEQIAEWQKARAEIDGPPPEREDLKALNWTGWQRLGGRLPSFGHAGGGLRDGAKHMKEHPEWFAQQADGTRDQGGDSRWRLCKSNPELIAFVANDIIERVKADPTLTLVSLDSNDGGSNTGFCLCERCKALDPPDGPKIQLMTFGQRLRPDQPARKREMIEYVSLTDRMVFYWNSIAERVTQVHPNVQFGVSVYSAWTNPPVKRRLHPNLLTRYVPGDTTQLKGWQEAGLRQVFWRPNILLFNRRDGKLKSFVGPLCDAMRTFADVGIRQTDFDSIMNNWATAGLSYYAAARLNWNPRLTADEIIRDYSVRGFGPAAEPVAQYFSRIESLSRKGIKGSHAAPEDYVYTPETTAELRGLLNAADAASGGDAEIRARIAFLRMGLNYTELHERLDDMARRAQASEPGLDRTSARQWLDLNYLLMMDIMIGQEMAVNVPAITWGSGGFAKWRPLPPPPAGLSKPALTDRLRDPACRQTGREDSLEALLKVFRLTP